MLVGLDVVVVGAGIGGLTTAVALAQRGARVRVLEQAPAIEEVGAGIQISPNGVAVLRALGLLDAVSARAVRSKAIELRDYRGARVLRMELQNQSREREFYFLHRADLVDTLARGADVAGVEIQLNARVRSIDTGAEGATVHLEDGSQISAALVVAADGLRSVGRAAVKLGTHAFFTEQVAWRAIVPLSAEADPEVRVYMGPSRHLVTYPLRNRKQMNLVAVQERMAWKTEGWQHPGDPDELRRLFSDFAPEAQSLLEQVQQVHVWGLFRHPVAERWYEGRLVLLGDAAHPTLPFLAQGACMAIEDAWVLADSLSGSESPEAALALYQTQRKPRCNRIVAAASKNARAYHLENAVVRNAAHTILRLSQRVDPGAALRRFDWLYGHDVTAH